MPCHAMPCRASHSLVEKSTMHFQLQFKFKFEFVFCSVPFLFYFTMLFSKRHKRQDNTRQMQGEEQQDKGKILHSKKPLPFLTTPLFYSILRSPLKRPPTLIITFQTS